MGNIDIESFGTARSGGAIRLMGTPSAGIGMSDITHHYTHVRGTCRVVRVRVRVPITTFGTNKQTVSDRDSDSGHDVRKRNARVCARRKRYERKMPIMNG
jgi:hypothetical protein